MADSTPLLSSYDHEDSHDEIAPNPSNFSPAAQLRIPIKILTIIILFLSISIFGLLIATHILINTGPWKIQYTWVAQELVRHLAICLFINTLYTAATLFLQIPIPINTALNIALIIVIFFFSDKTFGDGRTDSGFCLPETRVCVQKRDKIRSLRGVSGSFGILIGFLLVALLLLRLTALSRKRGERTENSRDWNETGHIEQDNPSILPDERQIEAENPPSYSDERPVIVTNPASGGKGDGLVET